LTRYKAVPVEGVGYYYESLLDYIHLNPVRAGLVKQSAGEALTDYPWSSVAGGYLMPQRKRVPWLAASEGLKAFDCADTVVGRRAWLERLERRALDEMGKECGVPVEPDGRDLRRSNLRRGWYWGSEAFSERLLEVGEVALKKKRHRDYRASKESRAHGEEVARRLLEEGLAVAKLRIEDLHDLPGSDVRKVAIAVTIWQRTTVKMQWLSSHLSMRSAANVSQQIRRFRQATSTIPTPLRKWISALQSENVA